MDKPVDGKRRTEEPRANKCVNMGDKQVYNIDAVCVAAMELIKSSFFLRLVGEKRYGRVEGSIGEYKEE